MVEILANILLIFHKITLHSRFLLDKGYIIEFQKIVPHLALVEKELVLLPYAVINDSNKYYLITCGHYYNRIYI